MADEIVIYHNPRCSKSRQTLTLVQERDASVRIVEYLKEPPSAEDIQDIADMLGVHPRELVRCQEEEYEQTGLSPQSSPSEVTEALAAHPKLLERPIVVRRGKARIGRPPESVLEILD